jgi:Tfp pilus assembly protein FimV
MARDKIRAVGLVLGSGLASGLLSWIAWPAGTALTDLPATPPDQTLPLLLCLAMSAVSAWVVVLLLLASASRLPGLFGNVAATAFRHLAPALVRRVVEVMLGATTVLAVTTATAQAAGPVQRPAAAAAQVAVASPTIVSLDRPTAVDLDRPAVLDLDRPAPPDLDRPAADPSRGIVLVTVVPTRSAAPQAKSATVRVRAGDSLWRIAERSLPPGSGPRAIEKAWHRWYAVNRAVIGSNPNLLQPGQQLVPPQS